MAKLEGVDWADAEAIGKLRIGDFACGTGAPRSGDAVYTDESLAYRGLRRHHKAVKHSGGEYVRAQASTNGMESFWAALKRGHDGVYHWMSAKHLHRYVTEFEGRHNVRPLDTADQMATMAARTVGKHLPYEVLIGPKYSRLVGGI